MAIAIGDKIPAPNFQAIPAELKAYPHWLLWQAIPMKNKPRVATKVPVTTEGRKFYCWNHTKHLYTFNEVEKAYKTGKFAGIGFALANTNFVCIDLDYDISTNYIPEELMQLTSEGYAEMSPSGKGVHIWFKGQKPEDMGRIGYTKKGEKLEVFSGSGWVTVTGNVISAAPIAENQPLLIKLVQAYFRRPYRNHSPKRVPQTITSNTNEQLARIKEKMFTGEHGKIIQALWKGDLGLFGGDHSRADFALCRCLAKYTNHDRQLMDALFRESALYRRKWDERRGDKTYGQQTIINAISYEKKKENTPVNSTNQTTGKERITESEVGESIKPILRIIKEIQHTLVKHVQQQEKINQIILMRLEREKVR